MSSQEDTFFWISPPETTGTFAVIGEATGVAADNYDWVSALGTTDAPKGSCWLYLEAATYDVFVRFKATTAAAATTANNGVIIPADEPGRYFFVNPDRHGVIDHISPGGTGRLKVQVSSPMAHRNKV